MSKSQPKAAEFFAGIGLVRLALEGAGIEVAWANDIEACKYAMYEAHFGPAGSQHYVLGDVRAVTGESLPEVEVATASFPCTDLSLAGNRAGLAGEQSGMFWEFARVVGEMGSRKPRVVMLENVPGFATSHGGSDLRNAILRLNDLGYVCDIFVVDAREFVPQSRLRLFIVGTRGRIAPEDGKDATHLRPGWIWEFAKSNPDLQLQRFELAPPEANEVHLADAVQRISDSSPLWWDELRHARFMSSLSAINAERLREIQRGTVPQWRTAYRRTRNGTCMWEIRPDDIAGCLRTARGGSSKQALVEIRRDSIRTRWMTPREYASLQGAPAFDFEGTVSDNKALFGFGDGVCVPVIQWIASQYLLPALTLCRELEFRAG